MTSERLSHEFSDLAEELLLVGEDGELCRGGEGEEHHRDSMGELMATNFSVHLVKGEALQLQLP